MTGAWEDGLAAWWATERGDDPAYHREVLPLLMHLLAPEPGQRLLDLGCGEGSVMAEVRGRGASVVGCDLSARLLERGSGPRVRARLPELAWVAPGSLDGVYAVLVLEHLHDVHALFSGAAAAVRPGGRMVVVVNHPVVTSPGSGPFIDPDDGEVLWRWGAYLEDGWSEEPAGERTVRFHHRPLGTLLTAAAVGWSLEALVERGVGAERAAADPLLAVQAGIPRLAGMRWVRASPGAG